MLRTALTTLLVVAGFALCAEAQELDDARPKSLLLFIHDANDNQAGMQYAQALKTILAQQLPVPPIFYIEYMEHARFTGRDRERYLVDYFKTYYGDVHLDAIVPVMSPATDFMLEYRDTLFPGTPIVLCGMDTRELDEIHLAPNTTGIVLRRDFAATLSMALDLQPKTRHVFLVSGSSDFEKYWQAAAVEELEPFSEKLEINYLFDLSMEEYEENLSSLPAHSIILYIHIFRDASGQAQNPYDALARLVKVANSPIYVFFDSFMERGAGYVGYGPVGGMLVSVDEQARAAASLVSKIFSRGSAAGLPPVEVADNIPVLDWRALKRWGIDATHLPPDTRIRHKTPTLWEEYRAYIIGLLLILVVQFALIGSLVYERARRGRTEASLWVNAQRMELARDAAKLRLWEWNVPRDQVWVSFADGPGIQINDPGAMKLQDLMKTVTPEDHDVIREAIDQSIRTGSDFQVVYRTKKDGKLRWWEATGRVQLASGPDRVRVYGASIDISERKKTEQELEQRRAELAHVGRLSTLGELTASLAHELKQPLTAILANAQAAQRILNSNPVVLSETLEILADIVHDDRKAAEIIDRVRSLVSNERRDNVVFDVNDTIRDVVGLARHEAELYHVRIDLQLDEPLPVVCGDPVGVGQIVLNLLVNAIDAAKDCPDANRRLLIVTDAESSGVVRISVSDKGPGLAPDQLEQVFTQFYTTKPNGLGMGLAISRSIAESLGGRLWVESELGKGATFYFSIPEHRMTSATAADNVRSGH